MKQITIKTQLLAAEQELSDFNSLFDKSFSIRRDVLDLTMAQWEIADSLDLTSITPRDWIRAIGARGGFLTALLTDEEREFVRIVYLQNKEVDRDE